MENFKPIIEKSEELVRALVQAHPLPEIKTMVSPLPTERLTPKPQPESKEMTSVIIAGIIVVGVTLYFILLYRINKKSRLKKEEEEEKVRRIKMYTDSIGEPKTENL